MIHLTEDQYDAFYLAALNLLSAIHEDRSSDSYEKNLAAYSAILTGEYPLQAIMEDIISMAKTSDRSTECAEAIIRRLLGDFTYPTEYWKKHSISMSEVEALGGIY